MTGERPTSLTIIGCGVIGLTSGIRLLEARYDVTIVARHLPPSTTSNVAAAVWFPFHVCPYDRALAWSRRSLDVFYELAQDPAAGISLMPFITLFEQPEPDPWWCEAVRFFCRPAADDLPPGYVDGHVAEVPLIETPVHMAWLVERFRALGGRIEQREVTDLRQEAGQRGLVINCTGLGARDLAADPGVYPIRGQIARTTRPAGIDRVMFDEHGRLALAYVIPRREAVIVGGTTGEGDWNPAVDESTAAEILAKGVELAPMLAGAEVLEHLVGLRPGRAEVRLEAEELDGVTVIHNYGHGGGGFTLSWGCADEVVALVKEATQGKEALSADCHWGQRTDYADF
jgi:D-amino-acid oxidase